MKTQLISVVAIAVTVLVATLAKAASFQGLGGLFPGPQFRSYAFAVSADGSVVVGHSGGQAFRWTAADGMQSLGAIAGEDFYTMAKGVSADGSVVVGKRQINSYELGYEAFRWIESEGHVLGDLPGGKRYWSYAFGVSSDGSVVVGYAQSTFGREAFRWTETGGMVGLGDLPGGEFRSVAYDVSADGLVVVGYSSSALGYREAFRWKNGVMTGLGDLEGSDFDSEAYAVSADGSVVVGRGCSSGEMLEEAEAFRWTAESGMVGLGMIGLGELPDMEFYSEALAVSADGSVVVGRAYTLENGGEVDRKAFIWDADRGIRSLKEVLENDHGLDLSGWRLYNARGISADGLTIVGYGHNPAGYVDSWIAVISKPMIEAGIDINPDTVNLKSKGKWINCYIWLPEEYNVADVNSYSVFLEDEIGAEWIWVDEEEQIVMTKFSRSEVQEMLEPGEVELTVSGELTDGTRFEGTDTIKVIDKGRTENHKP